MSGPSVAQIECPYCPCGQPGPWVARCCGRALGPIDRRRAHLATYFPNRTDAWLWLANHLRSEHNLDAPPLTTDDATTLNPYEAVPDPRMTLFNMETT